MGKTIAAIAAVLMLGLACMAISYQLFAATGRPNLLLRIVRDDNNADARTIRLANAGNTAQRIDLAGFEYFLYTPPNDPKRLIVQIQARRFFLDSRERVERETGAYALEPGESADIKDVGILLHGISVVDGARLGAILACYPPLDRNAYWHGFLRSAFIPEGLPSK